MENISSLENIWKIFGEYLWKISTFNMKKYILTRRANKKREKKNCLFLSLFLDWYN